MEYLVMYLVAGILYTGYRYAVDLDDFMCVLRRDSRQRKVIVMSIAAILMTAGWSVFYISNIYYGIKQSLKK